jgi:hypothetical protein
MNLQTASKTLLTLGILATGCASDGASDTDSASTDTSAGTDPTPGTTGPDTEDPGTTVGSTEDPSSSSTSGADSSTTADPSGGSSEDSSTGGDPSGVETEHGGLSLAEWMKLYWTWNLGGDQVGYEQDRMFLPLPAGTDRDMDMVFTGMIDVELAATDGFVLPMFAWIGETYENGDPVDDDPENPPEATFTGMNIVVTLDDVAILDSATDDLSQFYWDAVDFDETIMYPMPTDYGAVGAIWVKGVGFLHAPLAPGEHVLHLEEFNDEFMFGYSNTWNITVP